MDEKVLDELIKNLKAVRDECWEVGDAFGYVWALKDIEVYEEMRERARKGG